MSLTGRDFKQDRRTVFDRALQCRQGATCGSAKMPTGLVPRLDMFAIESIVPLDDGVLGCASLCQQNQLNQRNDPQILK